MIDIEFKNAKTKIIEESEIEELNLNEGKTPLRSQGVIPIPIKGLCVTDAKEVISDEFVLVVDGFLVDKGLWRTDWALSLYQGSVDNIGIYLDENVAECTSTSDPGSPEDRDTWETAYETNPAGPFTEWNSTKALCNSLFYCTAKCFCCDSQEAVEISCNKNIIMVHYIGYYPERGRNDYPLTTPIKVVLANPTEYGTDSHDEPDIEVLTANTEWCQVNTVTEERTEIAMNVLMEGGIVTDSEGNSITCDNGWHLNLNSQKCHDTECCNCATSPPEIGFTSIFVPVGGSQGLTVQNSTMYLPTCEFSWTLTGAGSFSPSSKVTTAEGTSVTYYGPADTSEGCSGEVTLKCMPNNLTDTLTIKITQNYLPTYACTVVEGPPSGVCSPYVCLGRVRGFNCLGTLLSDQANTALFNTRGGACGAENVIFCNSDANCANHIRICARFFCSSKCCYTGEDL